MKVPTFIPKDKKLVVCNSYGFDVTYRDHKITTPFKLVMSNNEISDIICIGGIPEAEIPVLFAVNPENVYNRIRLTKDNYRLTTDELFNGVQKQNKPVEKNTKNKISSVNAPVIKKDPIIEKPILTDDDFDDDLKTNDTISNTVTEPEIINIVDENADKEELISKQEPDNSENIDLSEEEIPELLDDLIDENEIIEEEVTEGTLLDSAAQTQNVSKYQSLKNKKKKH